jgi:Phenylalanyl-tRNA synthetase beta subunit
LSRDSLNTKVNNEIIGCEINIDRFSSEVLKYKEKSKFPDNFIRYEPISDLPYSIRDLSFSVKDFSKYKLLEEYILAFEDILLKKVFIFDFFYNEKNAKIKFGFRLVFQSSKSTITEKEINKVMKVIIGYTSSIDGVKIPGLD